MTNNRKQKLIALAPETLADALLSRSMVPGDVSDLIGQLIATPKENEQRFR